ncbi:F-box protein At3g26010-like isoform X1 [Brassica rapa]|uniref:F-box domain-containing protein n=1 Tax=Brassica campestris TaxID=3711 RepID=M4EYA8_BRACM|nr:F-box protein At3g26010-like isoform X1 [Brassica rapa]
MAMETKTHLLEVLQTEILARLPLRTICRFKSVCKTWKSTIESVYFRRLFLSLHGDSSSSSWSLMCGQDELIFFHGRKTWDYLPKSPAPLIPPSFKRFYVGDCNYADSSGGLVLTTDGSDKAYCYVGSPVLQQWIKIPPPPSDPKGDSSVFGLVTRLDEDGVVLSFKVIRIASYQVTNDYLSSDLSVLLYSSETGVWTFKVIHSPIQIGNMYNINLNGTIYFGCLSVPGVLLAHDFYSESDQFRVVQLPDYPDHNKDYKRTLTTSGGFVMYVRTLAKKEDTVLKIWRLMNNDDYSWQLLWEVGFPITGNYAPVAMHPFDVATVYLWSQRDDHLVSCNLRKQDYTVLGDAANDCFIDKSVCKKSVDELWRPRSSSGEDEDLNFQVCIWLFQFVIPRWMESVPRPPHAEMIDTTSLLSHATATHERMVREHETMMRERAAIMGDESNDEYFWMG